MTGVVVCFVRLVGGLETLSVMERIEVDEKDRPKVLLYQTLLFNCEADH